MIAAVKSDTPDRHRTTHIPSSKESSTDGARPLAGRHALVTGVSRRGGIGFAVAHRLATLGARITIHGYAPHDATQLGLSTDDAVDAVIDELRGLDPDVNFIEADFADPTAAGRVVAAAVEARGTLDILIANHARSSENSLDDVTAEELDQSFAVNARGSILLAQAFAAQREGTVHGGRIVMMTSGQHASAMPTEIAYAVSKGAIHQATRTLAAHLMHRGVTVNTVNPGPTDTGWADAETHATIVDMMPAGRWGSPSDAARLIAVLCGDDAAWVTGQVIDADGGFSL
jgi:3-oxoacyl-[acyl-carrier protein] reductase